MSDVPRSFRRLRLSAMIGSAGLGLLVLATTGLAANASADEATPPDSGGTFTVMAEARALDMAVETGVLGKPFPLVPGGQPPIYGSASSSQALVDSLADSTGYASAPYPGEFAQVLLPTVNGISRPGSQPCDCSLPPFPAYPFYVSSSYPGEPSAEQTNGPYGISSKSSENSTTADAHLGAVVGSPSVLSSRAVSTAERNPYTGAMVAKGDSVVQGFAIGPLLTIGDISAHAQLTAKPGEKPTRHSSFSVGTMTIAGVQVGLTDKGFQPLQGGPGGLPMASLDKTLAAAGIAVVYLPPRETETTIDSAGLAVTFTETAPVQGPVKVTMTFGRAKALLEPGAVPDTAGQRDDHSPAVSGPDDLTPTVGSASQAPPAASAFSGAATNPPETATPNVEPVAAPVAPPQPSALTGSVARGAGRPVAGRSRPSRLATSNDLASAIVGHKSSGVYLTLMAAALAAIAAAAATAGFGVRRLVPSAAATAAINRSVLRLPGGGK